MCVFIFVFALIDVVIFARICTYMSIKKSRECSLCAETISKLVRLILVDAKTLL